MAKKKTLKQRKRVPQTGSSNAAKDKQFSAKKPSAAERRANRTDRGKKL